MNPFQSYILVLDQHPEDLQMLESLLKPLKSSVVIASSAAQAMDRISQAPPYLVILTGSRQNWSHALVSQLREQANVAHLTIVALTDVHAPSWQHQEDNPGLDGFLVKPLSGDVVMSLVQSALARQTYCSA
jgi:DNA-binding NarL/FixJ family response regulator